MDDESIPRHQVERVVEQLIEEHFRTRQAGLYYRGANAMRRDIMAKLESEKVSYPNTHIDDLNAKIKNLPLPTAPQDKKAK